MKRFTYGLCITVWILIVNSCSTPGIFGNKSLSRQYADKLEQAGLHRSALGREWMRQSQKALETALAVNIPYRQRGYFAADVPRSMGIRLRPKRGQRLIIEAEVQPATGALLFIELWKNTGNVNKPKLITSADSSLTIIYDVDDDPELILTLQPELLVSASYTLSVLAEPSLAFPVPGNSGKKIGSFWGDERNGGSRKHEGIDIFDRFRTPLIAAEDGIITRVGENGLGGKVIWLSPSGKDYNLYYAHLDEQLAGSMQRVKKGDTIGLMGNTGNARYTPPHLHFGIYARGGAIDPLPFVQQVSKETPPIQGTLLNTLVRTKKKVNLQNTPDKKSVTITELPANAFLKIEAATGNYYQVMLPDESTGFVPLAVIDELGKPVGSFTSEETTQLLAEADSSSAIIKQIPIATLIKTIAYFNDYAFVLIENTSGWLYIGYAK